MTLLSWLLNNAIDFIIIGVLIWVGFLLYPRLMDYVRRHRPIKNPLDDPQDLRYPRTQLKKVLRERKEQNNIHTPTKVSSIEEKGKELVEEKEVYGGVGN